MHRSVIVGFVAIVAVVAGASGAVGAVTPADAQSPSPDAAAVNSTADRIGPTAAADRRTPWESQEFDSSSFDSTRFEITVHPNGSATWTIEYRRLLSPGDEESEFEEFAERFQEEETELYVRFTQQAESLLATGTEQTDREMEAVDFERFAGVEHRPNPTGVVEMSFTWKNFAPVTDDVVSVGDVFDGGLYIGPEQTLAIRAGSDLVFTNVRPEPAEHTGTSVQDSDTVIWNGERDFLDGRPSLVLEPEESVQGAGSGGDGGSGDGGSGGDEEGSTSDGSDAGGPGTDGTNADGGPLLQGPLGLVAGLALALALVAAAAAAVWYRYGRADGEPAGTDAAPESDPIPDEELLTDEDRVVSLIHENGGRMKQVDIVEETGWSKSKVSMLLSDMEEDGTISKLRVGRENIISLEGYEPEATKSPFEE